MDVDMEDRARAERSPGLDEQLSRQNWYLGSELSVGVILSVLEASETRNCYAVYKTVEQKYMLSARYKLDDVEDEIVDHLLIEVGEEGNYRLQGQTSWYEDIKEAVDQFVSTFQPNLIPALHGTSYTAQISISDDPPDYETANRVLKPDIAPLPDIGAVRVDSIKEAKTGRISPTSSTLNVRRIPIWQSSNSNSRPMWHHYSEHHRCHPKNVCFGCCYREPGSNYHRYRYRWYYLRGSGPLRVLGLLIFWLLCGLCFGCFKCVQLCFYLCVTALFGDYDS